MVSHFKKGRAEYETVSDCFEGIQARYILSPLFLDNHVKMIIGEKGSGKTHLAKLLSEEVPTTIYSLDKEKLHDGIVSYSTLSETSSPKVVVIDDLHYLLKVMQLYKLKLGDVNEKRILESLEQFKDDAVQNGSIPVFVADESPAGLCMRFEEKNRKRFLEIFDGCINSVNDSMTFSSYLKHFYDDYRSNVLNLDSRGLISNYRNEMMLDEMLKQDSWLKRPSRDWREVETAMTIKFSKEFNITGLPYAYSKLKARSKAEERNYFYPATSNGTVLSNITFIKGRASGRGQYFELDSWYKQFNTHPLATIRQFKVLKKELGDINMDNLDINIGVETVGDTPNQCWGWDRIPDKEIKIITGAIFSLKELWTLQKALSKKFYDAVRYDSKELVSQMLYCDETDTDALATLIEHQLNLE